jgi:hypothetical protein
MPSDGGPVETPSPDGPAEPPPDAGTRPDSDVTSCDPREVRCRRAEPVCPEGQVPEIIDSCYGECVPIDECVCQEAEACPHPEEFTCIQSTNRCSYYLF